MNGTSPFIENNTGLIRIVPTSRHWSEHEHLSLFPPCISCHLQTDGGPHCYEMKYIDGVTAVWRKRIEKILFLLVNSRLASWSGWWLIIMVYLLKFLYLLKTLFRRQVLCEIARFNGLSWDLKRVNDGSLKETFKDTWMCAEKLYIVIRFINFSAHMHVSLFVVHSQKIVWGISLYYHIQW